jgi:hypothetical protein
MKPENSVKQSDPPLPILIRLWSAFFSMHHCHEVSLSRESFHACAAGVYRKLSRTRSPVCAGKQDRSQRLLPLLIFEKAREWTEWTKLSLLELPIPLGLIRRSPTSIPVWRTSGDEQARRIASQRTSDGGFGLRNLQRPERGDIVDSVMPCADVPGGCIYQGNSVGPNFDWNCLHAALVSWGYG